MTVTVIIACPECDEDLTVAVDVEDDGLYYDAPRSCERFDGLTRRGDANINGPYAAAHVAKIKRDIEDATARAVEYEALLFCDHGGAP